MATVLVTIECREYFTIEVEAETTNPDDPAILEAYHSGDWGRSEGVQSDIIWITEVNTGENNA